MAKPTTIDSKLSNPDFSSPLMGGDFRLQELAIRSKGNPTLIQLNAAGVFESLDIFEDLFSNVLRGTLTFIDSEGLAEKIPIIGDEDLIISFGTPGSEGTATDFQEKGKPLTSGEKSEEVVRQIFKIYDCKETAISQEGTGKIYKLFFVSHEYVISAKTKISKGYKGKLYGAPVKSEGGSIVEDALKKLNINIAPEFQKNSFIEKTATPQNVIIPNWTPFQAINFCASRSTSASVEESNQDNQSENQNPFATGSLFVFYEKLGTGFFYESIESMIIRQKGAGRAPLYQYLPKTAGEASKELSIQYAGVDKFEIKSSFKTLENLGFGMYGSKLIAYDPIRMKFDEVKYDYYKKEDNPITSEVDPATGAIIETPETSQMKDDTQRIFADFISTDIHPTEKTQNKLISDKSDYLGSNDVSIKLATTTRDHDSMFVAPFPTPVEAGEVVVTPETSIGVTSKTFKDNESKPNKVENWLLQREAQLQEFGNIVVTFSVAGNSSRHVGDLIRFEVPSHIHPEPPAVAEIGHQLYSGHYLVSKIHHKITPVEYTTDFELIKNSFAKRIPGQSISTSTDGIT